MKIEVLLATMFYKKEDEELLKQMNIQSDIIVANQCDEDEKYQFEYNGNNVKVLSSSDRGVGINRNKALTASDADVVIFADNDVKYYDGYREIVEEYYKNNPKADAVIFNFKIKRGTGDFFDVNKSDKKATVKDLTKFGTYAITARRDSLLRKRIFFSLLFGGGAKYQCGEDSIFLQDCFWKKLKIYLCSKTLGEVVHKESTWFKGINEKYCFDKGALYRAAFGWKAKFFLLYHVVKHRKLYLTVGGAKKAYSFMKKGAKEYKGK